MGTEPAVRILEVRAHPKEELVANLRKVGMKSQPDVRPYGDADINIRQMETNDIWPAQRYVLACELRKIQMLESALRELGIDLYNLDGYASIKVQGCEDWIDVLPPVVEVSQEGFGKISLLNDGMHRVYMARMQGRKIKVIHINGVPSEYPYYAYPLPRRWADVEIINDLTKGYVKKFYRIEDPYSLYRDFDLAFDNVGGPRPVGKG